MKLPPSISQDPAGPRLITMAAYDGSEVLDITGPLDFFALTNNVGLWYQSLIY
jgi:hypothetical protein